MGFWNWKKKAEVIDEDSDEAEELEEEKVEEKKDEINESMMINTWWDLLPFDHKKSIYQRESDEVEKDEQKADNNN